MPRPTQDQLDRINRFAMTPRTAEDTFVFESMMIDDQPTSYSSKLHPVLLNKFVQDANRGVGLLMNHNHGSLPVGRSFGAHIRGDFSEHGEYINSVYGEFYMDLGRRTESGMTTDDLAKGIEAGTVFDTSIGFNATKWDCSICGHDIRDYSNCSHYPGRTYQVEGPGSVFHEETCYVVAGADGKGELLENSLVYAGAAPRATITKSTLSAGSSDRKSKEGSTLSLVDTFKNIPLNATIYSFYTKDGAVLYTDTDERTSGVEVLEQRSDTEVEFKKFQAVLGEFGVKFENEEELKSALSAVVDKSELETKLAAKEVEMTEALAAKDAEMATIATDLAAAQTELSAKDEVIGELTLKNEELSVKAGLGETYRSELEKQTIEYGVRVMGNAFNTDLFNKFLSTLSVEEVKAQLSSFQAQHEQNLGGNRQSETTEPVEQRLGNEPTSQEDFESEVEFRDYVAAEAVKYANEHGVSLVDATKLMYQKHSAKEAK
ncbi:hypothetical protein ACP26L_36415 (plasmid) [Paenibacillus sp. S-38]|uniref:hypothetical protein n=1 Tax=Paenibacillus sp. S-38 TaxID=3416710 RepID=UPI003CF7DAA3